MPDNSNITNHNRIIDDYIEMLNTILNKVPEAEGQKDDCSLKYAVATELGFKILDLKSSIDILLENNFYAGILSLSRNMLENYIYLVYILSDDSCKRSRAYQLAVYTEIYKQGTEQKRNIQFQEMIKEDESLNGSIEFFEQNRKEVEESIKELNELYGHKLNKWYNDDNKTNMIWKLFKRVGKSYLYDTAYRYLCVDTHGTDGMRYVTQLDNGYVQLKRPSSKKDEINSITTGILIETKKELEKLIL